MVLSERFDQALSFASALHRQQMRKGTSIPYVSHLLAVAALVIENGGDEDLAIAALLHDAVEDQGGAQTLEVIRTRFGERVARIVEACSDAQPAPGQQKAPWRQRKERYLEHLRSADSGMLLVSLADKVHNARAILVDLEHLGDALWTRFKGGRDGSLWYYRALTAIFESRRPPDCRLLPQLRSTVESIERLSTTG